MKESRTVDGMRWARALEARPSCIPPLSKLEGAKGIGIRFERKLHRVLPGSAYGQWFEFEDEAGFGYCQTDLLVSLSPGLIAVLEAKYTLVPGAHAKLAGLYVPVVEKALGCKAVGVVVVKNLDPRFRRGRIFTDLHGAASDALESGYPSLIQWSGQSLLPRRIPSSSASPARASPPGASPPGAPA